MASPNYDEIYSLVSSCIDEASTELRTVSMAIHDKPELGFQEFFAHETITSFLEKKGFEVKRKAYGLDTSFEASLGSGGRQVIICVEYDALPDIGHGCGHNLIATSSLAAFLGAAHVMSKLGIEGRLKALGTPAEEGGGGKAKLITAGAFSPPEDVAASIMAHPASIHMFNREGHPTYTCMAGYDMIASNKFRAEFRGQTAHAASEPWNGVNALDAAVSGYNNVSMLRQQIKSDERVHGVFEVGGTVPNVIPDYARMNWYVRSATSQRADLLEKRVKACLEAGALAAGCEINYIETDAYKHVIPNPTLCKVFGEYMEKQGEKCLVWVKSGAFNASTDMGNVTHFVPGIHAGFGLQADRGIALHSRGFAAAAATDSSHEITMKTGKGLAMLALRVLLDDEVAKTVREEFDRRYD